MIIHFIQSYTAYTAMDKEFSRIKKKKSLWKRYQMDKEINQTKNVNKCIFDILNKLN